jgi:four helix bundle protein
MNQQGQQLQDLKSRTKQFALRVLRLCGALPKSLVGQSIGRQLVRSGTSVGAHYREAIRSRSNAEFISKIEAGLQELEESGYWLKLLAEGNVVPAGRLKDLIEETNELTKIMVSMVINVKKKNRRVP